ncbi:lipopolysaccharide transport periplasmic protein LptA [Gallaecimonas sp. GXIMD1310]|uniref:lipopolysaccharide transport periplasmic protein LptA n=1 Tax=Gallaecimonas sp. GXIMD1310 TaxID=3131926 RepID=UPI0032567083
MNKQIILSLLLAVPLVVQAADNDFSQQLKINANNTDADNIKKTLVYQGDVNIRQGSLHIQAERLEIDGNPAGRVLKATGSPVLFEQQLDDGSWVRAQADQISYYDNKRLIVLSGHAQVQQATSTLKGDTIRYDLGKQQLQAKADSDTGRVTTILAPSQFKEAPTPPPKKEDPATKDQPRDDNQPSKDQH